MTQDQNNLINITPDYKDKVAEQEMSAGALRRRLYNTMGTESYESALRRTQKHLSDHLSGDVSSLSKTQLMDHILKYITDYNVTCSLTDEAEVLANYIYHDMAEHSFISREGIFEIPGFEELDINGWNDVDIIIGGKRSKTDYSFNDPKHANDIMRRIMQATSTPFDDAMPFAITDMGTSVRIASLKNPVIDDDRGLSASIRKVSGSTITRETLVKSTLTDDMLDLLSLFIQSGISTCFSGETGSGKTTLSGYLLYEAAKNLRMVTIEEGSREWNFVRTDENGKVTNSVVHMKTRPDDDKKRNIDQNRLLQIALRLNPTVIGVGEMRSDEAYAAAEASNTGHTVVSTVHANSAPDAPRRIVGLCKKAYDFSDDTLMDLVTNAFPIQVYQEFLPDGSRRVTEIIEVLGFEHGKLQYNTLVEYVVEDNIKDKNGNLVEVVGGFQWKEPISEHLQQKMLKKGATKKDLERFLKVV